MLIDCQLLSILLSEKMAPPTLHVDGTSCNVMLRYAAWYNNIMS